jgi:hypothetical protein
MITGPIQYKLSRPVKSVDRDVAELSLREPTGLDMRSCGDQSDAGFTHRLIARLAGITPAAVDAMAGRDVIALGRIINRDFLEPPEPETSSTDITSADGSGAAA